MAGQHIQAGVARFSRVPRLLLHAEFDVPVHIGRTAETVNNIYIYTHTHIRSHLKRARFVVQGYSKACRSTAKRTAT